MKKAKKLIFLSLVLIILLLVYFNVKNKTPKDIYNENIDSIVELKVKGDNYLNYGTGIFINDNYIISNAHLSNLQEETKYFIRFSYDIDYYEVELIDYYSDNDLLILKTNDFNKNKIKLCKDDNFEIGDKVYAIGNSLNNGIGITEGIISVDKVNIRYNGKIQTFIQADVLIASGNSGGALLNKKGELIGITTFSLKDEKADIIYGMCYAIPIWAIVELIEMYI